MVEDVSDGARISRFPHLQLDYCLGSYPCTFSWLGFAGWRGIRSDGDTKPPLFLEGNALDLWRSTQLRACFALAGTRLETTCKHDLTKYWAADGGERGKV